jgi:O-succinylbenzoic acid--CoA ligase
MEPGHWLSGAAARHPDRTAVETPDGSATYQELLRRARGAAGALERRGARRREPVALALAPGLEFVETLHGCLLLGAPALPVDPRLGERERTALLRDATLVVDRPLDIAHEPALPPPPAGDDVALVIHTSGTTGAPEPVGLTFGNVRANAEGLARTLELRDDERWLCPLPLSHVGGLMILLRSVLMGTTAVLAPPSAAAGDAIGLVSLVPTQLQRLLDAGATPGPQLRRVLLGGGPMPPALLERAASAGWPVSASYGLTQACSTVTVAEPGDTATAGRPLPGVHVGVAPDGEILVSGPDRQRRGHAAHRGPGAAGRAGPPRGHGPPARPDRLRRGERRAGRGRSGAVRASGRDRGGRLRPRGPGGGRR